jgi:hypothetical protein
MYLGIQQLRRSINLNKPDRRFHLINAKMTAEDTYINDFKIFFLPFVQGKSGLRFLSFFSSSFNFV